MATMVELCPAQSRDSGMKVQWSSIVVGVVGVACGATEFILSRLQPVSKGVVSRCLDWMRLAPSPYAASWSSGGITADVTGARHSSQGGTEAKPWG